MKTPNLIDVPKDHPSRKEKLDALKKEHGIQTHDAGAHWGRGSGRWCAILFDQAWELFKGYCDGDKTFFGLTSRACRLVEEAGLLGYGDSEIEAIRMLCNENKIPCSF